MASYPCPVTLPRPARDQPRTIAGRSRPLREMRPLPAPLPNLRPRPGRRRVATWSDCADTGSGQRPAALRAQALGPYRSLSGVSSLRARLPVRSGLRPTARWGSRPEGRAKRGVALRARESGARPAGRATAMADRRRDDARTAGIRTPWTRRTPLPIAMAAPDRPAAPIAAAAPTPRDLSRAGRAARSRRAVHWVHQRADGAVRVDREHRAAQRA